MGLWAGLVRNMMNSYPILYQWYSFCFYSLFHSILYLPIESKTIDRFWYWRCLNDNIDLPNMIRLFASSAISSLMSKNGTKENFSNTAIFKSNFSKAEMTLGFLKFIIECCPKIKYKKFKSIGPKMKMWQWFLQFSLWW